MAVVNGTFFFTGQNPAKISFGLKFNNTIVSYGDDLNGYTGLYRTFAFKPDRARIQTWSKTTFNEPTIPQVIGALDPTADKSKNSNIARTFVGTRDDDKDPDKTEELVFIYSSKTATQKYASDMLTAFGATSIVMMDGGGSGALFVAGSPANSYPPSATGRLIPHTIAVYAGK